jgi:metal-sulfur cluster biosynthetic enzyme
MRSHENEPIAVRRDVKAVAIPAGVEVNLKVGQVGYITQALGGSFTVYVDGNLFRIAGSDADAIGMTVAKVPEVPVNIVDLGLVYACEVHDLGNDTRSVDIKMTLTAPGCGMGEVLVQDVREKIQLVPTVSHADVELVFDPPWNQTMMSDEARLQTGMM